MLGVGVSLRHMRGATSALAFYAANGLRPEFVLDPSRQKYFTDGSPTNLAGAVNHSRASGATYLDSSGVLQTAASGEIRDQAYAYVDGVLTGPYVLTEPDGVNLLPYSEEFDNASWVKSTGVTVTANTDVAPDGTTSADTVTSGANQITQGVSCVQNTVYTDSLFFKKTTEAAYTPALYLIFTGGTAVTYAAVINTNTGVHTVVTASGFTAPSAVSVSDAGAYWRLSVSGNSGNNTTVDLRMYPNFNPVTAGVGPGSQVIWGAQLEAGSIPTSYIPTSGSQGARAEDVLTIPDAPWPEAVTTGPELVTNGTFDTDLSGWILSGDPQVVAGRAELSRDGTIDIIRQSFSTEIGKVYQVTGNVTGTSGKIGVGTSNLNDDVVNLGSLVNQDFDVLFVASTTTTYIYFITETTGLSSWDDISVKEITPRAIGISMKGLMTYADDNTAASVSFYRRYLDGNNRLGADISGSAGGTGALSLYQVGYGVVDTVLGIVSEFSPGINVPFSIASRHGDSFLNGAVDGVALTENTTPTILPDLSAAPIAIRPSGGPLYLEEMRIWVEGAVDKITDTLIEEASP